MTISTIKDLVALGGYDDVSALVSYISATGKLPSFEDRAELDLRALITDAERLMDPAKFCAEFHDYV